LREGRWREKKEGRKEEGRTRKGRTNRQPLQRRANMLLEPFENDQLVPQLFLLVVEVVFLPCRKLPLLLLLHNLPL